MNLGIISINVIEKIIEDIKPFKLLEKDSLKLCDNITNLLLDIAATIKQDLIYKSGIK